MAGEPKTDDVLIDEIDQRLRSLEPGAPAGSDDGAWSIEEISAECARLRELRAEVVRHSRLADVSVAALGGPTFCRECGEPRFCAYIRGRAHEFGIPITAP